MWPTLLDMTKDECKRTLRKLELEAYGCIVSALRAQGALSSDKHQLLQNVAGTLNIPQERHRAEVRRAVNDERLATIAHCMTGDDTTDEWALEGRRLVPLMPRMVPQSAYSVIADDEANKASIDNEKLPHPANTERKRPSQSTQPEPTKSLHYRVPSESAPKVTTQNNIEDLNNKKRKLSLNVESSSLAQHLMMGQPKISRVQQLYRQKTKAILKAQMKNRPPVSNQQSSNVQKPVLRQEEDNNQSLEIQPPPLVIPKTTHENNKVVNPVSAVNTVNTANTVNSAITNENQVPKSKPTVIHTNIKPSQSTSNTKVQSQTVVSSSTESAQKSIKICPARKAVTSTSRTQSQPQKVIIVSTAQGPTTSSILQRTLTIPFVKTISMKNLDKVKVINNAVSVQSSPGTSCITSTASSQKPKLLTVQTKVKSGTPAKHLNIPFIQGVQLQALQNKGAIKMVPLSNTKVVSKPGIINTTSGSVYIMNSNSSMSAVTASNSTPIISSRTQNSVTDHSQDNDRDRGIIIIKNEEVKPPIPITSELTGTSESNLILSQQQHNDNKSSVLAEILKASGVVATEDVESGDIESQITQLTEIPNAVTEVEKILQTVTGNVENSIQAAEIANIEIVHEEESQNHESSVDIFHSVSADETIDEHSDYVILQDNIEETESLLLDEEQPQSEVCEEMLMGSLDPETGMYSLKTPQDYELMNDIENNLQQTSEDYVIEMDELHNSDLDMPSLIG